MKKRSMLKLAASVLICLICFIQCWTGSETDAGDEKQRLRLSVISGNGQNGTGGHLLADALMVRATDSGDNPVTGLYLNVRVVEGGGNIPEGWSPETDAFGQSSFSWVIGSGYNGIEVTVNSDVFEAAPVYFWAEGENPYGIHITRTIASFRQVEGVLYEMTFYGDYSRGNVSVPGAKDRQVEFTTAGSDSYHCSLFSVFGLAGQYRLGRSFDNPSGWKCLTLLTRINPNDGYASIAPMRLRDINFTPETDFDQLTFEARERLLNASRFPPDGVNETGLVMGLANVTPQPYNRNPEKETLHCCLWVRKVLNECRTVDEAIALTMRYNIQGSSSTLDVHAMVADASGHSIILEAAGGEMKVIRGTGPFQVMTNSPVYQVPLETQLNQCPRFRYIYETLDAAEGRLDAGGCWDILQEVGNSWTEWSAVYGITEKSATLAIDFDFEPLYDFYIFPL
jgi:hypothetical protein